MRQVSVIVHLDLEDDWTDRELEAYVDELLRPHFAAPHDVEVVPDSPRPAAVPFPVPAEDVPQAFLTARDRCRASGWSV